MFLVLGFGIHGFRERRVANEMGVGEERAEERDGLDLVDFDPIVKRTPAGREKVGAERED